MRLAPRRRDVQTLNEEEKSCSGRCSVFILRGIQADTGHGARNLETIDYVCFYAGAMESQNGQADVICRNKTIDGVSFEARKK